MDVSFSPDGSILACVGFDGSLSLWQTEDWSLAAEVKSHKAPALSVSFSADGSLIASSSRDNLVSLWTVPELRLDKVLEGHANWVETTLFSCDESLLYSADWNGEVRVWDYRQGSCISSFRAHRRGSVMDLAVDPVSKILASCGQDNMIRLWRQVENRSEWSMLSELDGHDSTVRGVVFIHDGRFLVSAGQDKILRIWDLSTCEVIAASARQPEWLTCLAGTSDARLLATGDLDGRILLFRLEEK
jgi:WD40 repeat protein